MQPTTHIASKGGASLAGHGNALLAASTRFQFFHQFTDNFSNRHKGFPRGGLTGAAAVSSPATARPSQFFKVVNLAHRICSTSSSFVAEGEVSGGSFACLKNAFAMVQK